MIAALLIAIPQNRAGSADIASAFHPVGPARVADTRDGSGFVQIDDDTIRVPVVGRFGITAITTVVVLTVTATDTAAAGFVTVFPSGTARPAASNLNINRAGETIANSVIVALGTGAVDLYTHRNTDLVIDIVGVFIPAMQPVADGRLVLLPGAMRALDTRVATALHPASPVAAGATVRVALPAGVPADASALAVNLTTTGPNSPGFWTAHAAGAGLPLASSLNTDRPDETRAAFAIVPAGPGGIEIFGSRGGNLVVDVIGWFTGTSSDASDRGLFVATAPSRMTDTRLSLAPLYPDGTVEVAGPSGAMALAVNVTATDAFDAGYVTAFPSGTTRPPSSNVNAMPGDDVANAAIVAASHRGISLFSQSGTDVVVDLAGWFTGGSLDETAAPATNTQPVSRIVRREIGTSVGGRPLVAYHRVGGTTAARRVIVVGSIHGEEPAGIGVVNVLAGAEIPSDLDLWLIPASNPDGLATGHRTNGAGVDLNRNFPTNWSPSVGAGEAADHNPGPSPASEPETQALMRFVAAVAPTATVWYHQPLTTVDCNLGRSARLAADCTTYASTVGLSLNLPTGFPPGFLVRSGTATDWQMTNGLGVAFVVEFASGTPSRSTIAAHAKAVLTTLSLDRRGG